MIHNTEILEQVWDLHGVALRELGELMFPVEKSLAKNLPIEEIRAENDLPEI